jgi:N-methylhydantoinase B
MRDLGTLELVRESLVAVVNEMRANVIHSSYSSIIYEGHDFSCALVTADGRLVAQSLDDSPIHIFAVPYSTAEVVKAFGDDIHDGDIFLHNDPYTGGTHLNDVLMLYPVFNGDTLALFVATRCHWGDVGGMTPGSLSGRAKEIYQEGLRITPTRICERGKMNDAYLTLLFDNMRVTHERKGDFNTMLGTSRKAAEHLGRLFARFGGDALLDSIEELIGRSAAVMRERIAALPDGVYHGEGYIEGNGNSPEPLVGRLKLTVDGDTLIADFTGSSPQTGGPTNVGPAMAFNGVGSIVKSFLDPHTPVNQGSVLPIEVINPVGSFLNARLPAPCGGMVECRALICGLMVAALGQAAPDKLVGDLKGGGNHVYVSGPQPERDDIFLCYEYPAGGTGGCKGVDGNHAARAFPEGDFNSVQSAEVIEAQCPLRVEYYGLRDGSCGDGAFRGGLGMRREIKVLSDTASLSVLSDKNIIPPFGVAGGGSGAPNRFTVVRDGVVVEPSPMPGKVAGFEMQVGDVVRMESSGGGGYGDPLERDPSRVAEDVAHGYIAAADAETRYGVRLDSELRVDAEATAAERAVLRAARVAVTVEAANRDAWDGPRRLIAIAPPLAADLAVGAGDIVEIISEGGASLRGWVTVDPSAQKGAIALGPDGVAALAVCVGDTVRFARLKAAAP